MFIGPTRCVCRTNIGRFNGPENARKGYRMNVMTLVDFLCQENIGLKVSGCALIFSDGHLTFQWFCYADVVDVYRSKDFTCDTFDNVDSFMVNESKLSGVLDGIRDYRTDKGK